MKRHYPFLLILISLLVACGNKPDPALQVRTDRRLYLISNLDWAPSESGVLTYEFTIQNTAGKLAIQDLTVIAQAYKADETLMWTKTHTLDVSTLGKYATKVFTFQENVENISEVDAFQVVLAPDDEGSPYKNYREFQRIAQ
ncbi:MAG: hypothetical protein H6510_01105 [Acidobacteria bacterium]|nr:hypothetical protein [Acidobacteriota bacterium]MCB9396387.1 hypothetical protein [Acidobacteriota bacterium]